MNLLMTVGKKQGRIAIEGVGASDGARLHPGSGDDAAVAVLRPNAVEGTVEFEAFVHVVEQVHLEPAFDQVAEAHADEADLHAAVVQLIEEGLDLGNEDVIGRGIGNARLRERVSKSA